MPSGYEKSPDYGGPPPDWISHAGAAVLIFAGCAIAIWLASLGREACRVVTADQLETVIRDGKTVMSLDQIKPGECVTIRPL